MRLLSSLIFICFVFAAWAQEPPNITPSQGKYNPERTKKNDLIHTKLELRPNWDKQQMYSVATITFKPHFYPQSVLELDAKGFDVQMVRMKNKELKFDYNQRLLKIDLGKTLTRKDSAQVQIVYIAKPNELPAGGSEAITADKGLYFINADGSDPEKPRQIWTQGETEANSCWFPTIDSPNQKTTLEIFITLDKRSVDAKYLTLSNGKLISSKVNSDGTRTDYWRQDKPAAPYLTMIAVGDFRKVVDPNYKKFEVSYYVEPKFEKYAMNIFGRTPEMISYFENLLGVGYQWDKYSQIAVREYVSGAMENTTATVHGDFVQKDNHQLADDNDDGVIAHELFHHWFGDLVTAESWANLPLNESFANYSEYLWTAHKYGQDEADLVAYIAFNQYFSEVQEKQEPLIRYHYNDKEDMFDSHSYAKGGRILHLLRKQVGDEAFFASLKLYLTQNAFKTGEIDQLRLAFELVTGEDLHWFFDQWFMKSGNPDLQVIQEYTNGKLKLVINQIQDTTYSTLYRLPLQVEIWSNNQKSVHEILVDKFTNTFEWNLQTSPQMVYLDPENTLVGRVLFQKNKEDYIYQYYHAERVPARLNALEILTYVPEGDSMVVSPALDKDIRKVLIDATRDKFWRVRQLAVQKLYDYDGDDFLEVERALQSRVQNDERSYVRADAIIAMKGFQNSQNDKLFRAALNDTSYTVQAAALEAILGSRPTDAAELVKKYENSYNTAIFSAVANYFSEESAPERFNWYIKHLSKMSGGDLYQVLGIFGTYLVKSSPEIQAKSLPLLKKIATKDTQWYVRFAGLQTLALLSDLKEAKDIIKEVIATEKDQRLQKVYQQYKDL
ncbi:M1 family aminopeptidase [Emticicia sp. BO119]|uniref:M1 family aminopeptidase n=1 Tax=Emticicia sp. BO119 TaxID=2757768 RepID=UPI0015F0FF9A|nr:M1 family aminopeptidase [Emticicia sp. BO119]MBA4849930.1 M1 family metallopeptidase [Emticicia sp. BO119]